MSVCPTTKPTLLLQSLRTTIAIAMFSFGSILLTQIAFVDAGTIYKSIDKDGNIIFTDQPLEGAETHRAEQPAVTATNAPNAPNGEQPRERDSNVDAARAPGERMSLAPIPKNPPKSDYQESEDPNEALPVNLVEILTPIHDATLQDPIGKIWVELQSYPTPMKDSGLTAELWMDDQLINSGKRPMLSLQAPERGTHVLVVRLVDDNGKLHLKSAPSHIHVKYRVKVQ